MLAASLGPTGELGHTYVVNQQPLTTLLPVAFSAGGALAGVVLTLVVQALNAAKQRHDERKGRAFELRFELYADLLYCAESLPELREETDRYTQKRVEVTGLIQTVIDRTKEYIHITSEIPRNTNLADLDKEWALELLERSRVAQVKVDEARKAWDSAEHLLSLHRDEADEFERRYFECLERFSLGSQKMWVLSDLRTWRAAAAIRKRVADKQSPTSAEYDEFRQAVRLELNLDQRSLLVRARDRVMRTVRR